MQKLILIDSHALIHRVYHALPPLKTKKGEPINAVYGFTSILLKILNDLKPDYLAAAFDLAEPTHRHIEFKNYKAHRPKTPDDLAGQFLKVKKILTAFNIPVFEKSGFEADDIIATIIAKIKCQMSNVKCVIVSGDLDLLQLVDENVEVYTLKKGITETSIYDLAAVKNRYELEPKQLADFKALKGDISDNIPGVKGVGEKTAIYLIKEFGNLDNLYKNLDNLKNKKTKEKLEAGKDDAYLSYALVSLRYDAPVDFELADCRTDYEKNSVLKIFEEFEFNNLIKRLTVSQTGLLTGQTELSIGQSAKQKEFPMQTDLSVKQGELFKFNAISEEKSESKKIENFKNFNIEDLQIAAYLIEPGQSDYTLERLASAEGFNLEIGKEQELAVSLKEKYLSLIKQEGLTKIFYEIELPLKPILRKMEETGIKVDAQYLKKLNSRLDEEINETEKEIFQLAGKTFNINSPIQVSEILSQLLPENKFGKTETGKISTDNRYLEKIADLNPIINLILQFREFVKIKNTYVENLINATDINGRVHTSYSQIGTATGRLTSQNPNLQNLPKSGEWGNALRAAFIAEDGYQLVSFDYSQLELRLAAHLSGDENLISAFKNRQDIHKLTAAKIKNIPIEAVDEEMRQQAKIFNFGILYGMGKKSLAEEAKLTNEEAGNFILEYFKNFPFLVRFIEDAKNEARQLGKVRTLFGRLRNIDNIDSSDWRLKSQAERAAVNFKIQGLNADIIKLAMVKIADIFNLLDKNNSVRLLLQIHDELVFEIKEEEAEVVSLKIKNIMENIIDLKISLDIQIKKGKNLAELL